MTKETQGRNSILSVAEEMFDVLDTLNATEVIVPDSTVVSVVRGFMLAYHDAIAKSRAAAPAEPKQQRRARRKKADEPGTMVELAKGAINA